MDVNFGGFVPLSTVDWRGRSVCTVFLRGCPVHCFYCHNREIQNGTDWRTTDEILGLIQKSALMVSGVIFSGGEPTMQKEPLVTMARGVKKMGLLVGIQTNGAFPETAKALLDENLLDLVHLDIKTRWEQYPRLLKVKQPVVDNIRTSLALYKEAYFDGRLPSFEIVVTLFRGHEEDVPYIAEEAEGIDLVLQQGVYGEIEPLSFDALKDLAADLGRPVRIRTREDGEVTYDKNRIIVADSMVLTDIRQLRRPE